MYILYISLCNISHTTLACVRGRMCVKVERQRILVDTAAALESDNAATSHLFHLSLSSLPPSSSLFYSLPGSSAEASTITATSTCLLTVSNGDRRLRRREGEDSGCTPATMGENCHNDRGGDREMKGSGGGKTSMEGGAGERDVVWKEGRAKIKRELKRGR